MYELTYFFDGTNNGFLTVLTRAFSDENAVVVCGETQLTLGSEPLSIVTDEALAKRVEARLRAYDSALISELSLLLRCSEENAAQTAFAYARLVAKRKRSVRGDLSDERVFLAMQALKRIRFEIHRFHGFIRFMETASGALYAPFEPDNDICDLLVPHFKARLPQYPFVLHDLRRGKAAIYDGNAVFLAPLKQAEVVISANEDGWRALFREYYQAVNIPSRERLRQMRNSMPVRYHKYLVEKTP